jgi:hypothetical protein
VTNVTPKFESRLWKCTVQARLARQLLLPWGGRRVLLRRLVSLIVYLLTILDSQSSKTTGHGGFHRKESIRLNIALETADAELKSTKSELRRLALRDTQWLYLLGMVPGILLLPLIVPVASAIIINLVVGNPV